MRSFNYTKTGTDHIRRGIPCQDFSASLQEEQYSIAVVSDGHGSPEYFRSDRGSRFAVKAFTDCVQEAFRPFSDDTDMTGNSLSAQLLECDTQRQRAEIINLLIHNTFMRWNLLVDEDIAAEPFTEEELATVPEDTRIRYQNGEKMHYAYGATLIGTVMTDSFWFGIQIGDGKCIVFDRNGVSDEPIPWDDDCFLNITTSLCDSNALHEFRQFSYIKSGENDMPAAVFISSDGIDDCFPDKKRFHNFYRTILSSFAHDSEENAFTKLEASLPQLSAQGSGDDVSSAGFIDIPYITDNPALYEQKKTPHLCIMRIGDLGADSPERSYMQKIDIEAEVGVTELYYIGCGGFGRGIQKIDVLSCDTECIRMNIADKEYEITPDKPIELQDKKLRAAGFQYDTLIVQMYLK